jgi:hypothetical protein
MAGTGHIVYPPAVPSGELIFANVLDERQRAVDGEAAEGFVYLLAPGTRALPFDVVRDYKAPTGYLAEEVQLVAPSGKVAHRIGPKARWLSGMMDLTRIEDRVADAMLDELGTYLASFLLDDELLGQTELQVVLQAAPEKLPKEYEDGFRKSDVIWVGVEHGGRDVTIPAWFAYRNGRVLVLSSLEPSLEEQTVPGLPEAKDLVVITRRKLRETGLDRFHAAARILEGPEWESAAAVLADRRRSRPGPPQDAITRWRGTCAIAELTPIIP